MKLEQSLATKRLLFSLATLIASVLVYSTAAARPIRDVIGAAAGTSGVADGLSIISDAEVVGDELHIVGSNGERPARQRIDLTSGSVQPVENFMTIDEFNSGQGFATETSPELGINGQVTTLTVMPDGSVRYSGSSQNSLPDVSGEQLTIWHDPMTPVGLPTTLGGGFITDSNAMGLFSGGSSDMPVVSSESVGTNELPVNFTFGFANAISKDGTVIVGTDSGVPTFWRATDIDTLQYEIQNTLETPPNGALAGQLLEIVEDPQFGMIGFGHYYDIPSATSAVGAWDLSNGSFIRGFGPGSSFADAALFQDTLVVAFNNSSDGFLDSLFDANPISMTELTGSQKFLSRASIILSAASGVGPVTSFIVSDGGSGRVLSSFSAISAPTTIPGDYDGNWTVDGGDYLAWQRTFGSRIDLRADGNGDGIVDAADYSVWRDHYGATAAGLSQATVPEPCTMLLMVCSTLLSRLHRWR